jgi:hypothetical protein
VDEGNLYKTQNSEVSIGKRSEYSGNKDFLRNSSSPATKRKDGQMGLHGIKKLLHNKRNDLKTEESTHRMREIIRSL